MSRKIKIVFYVETPADGENFDSATNEIIVEKSQTILELYDERPPDKAVLSVKELARDHVAEIKAVLDSVPDGSLTSADRDRLIEIRNAKVGDELLTAAGDLIGRSIRMKLRDWARAQKTPEPVA